MIFTVYRRAAGKDFTESLHHHNEPNTGHRSKYLKGHKYNQRDLVFSGIWDKLKRIRAGVKANYGDDSQQFEMVGGKRTSERKSPTRRTTTV